MGPYSIDTLVIDWGDESSPLEVSPIPAAALSPSPPAPPVNVDHQYTKAGIYNISITFGDSAFKRYNTAYFEIAYWNHTIQGLIINTETDIPITVNDYGVYEGRITAINATNPKTASIEDSWTYKHSNTRLTN